MTYETKMHVAIITQSANEFNRFKTFTNTVTDIYTPMDRLCCRDIFLAVAETGEFLKYTT